MDSIRSKHEDEMNDAEFLAAILFHDFHTASYTHWLEYRPNLVVDALMLVSTGQKKGPQKVNFEGTFMSRIYVQRVIPKGKNHNPLILFGDPNGIRTRVTGVRGRRPEPLDDGTV